MELKLDKIDKKLLSYIFHNFREPITTIAKACKISREQAEYRIKKYEEKGLIKKYLTLYDLHLLGYERLHILKIRVKSPNIEKLSQIKETDGTIIFTRAQCYGLWDYNLSVLTKEKSNILDLITSLYELWGSGFLNYEILEPIQAHYFSLKIFGDKKESIYLESNTEKKQELDELDHKIIKELSKNAKIKIVEIANNLKEKAKTINYRLKRLEKNTILGYRALLDLDVIGYKLAQIYLKFNNLSQAQTKKIFYYGANEDKIHSMSTNIGKYNVIFQIIYKHAEELIREINKIKETFSESIIDYELLHVEKELLPRTI